MVDKKTESGIKALKGFMEFWTKLHSLYTETIQKDVITAEDEKKFLDARDIIRTKYEELKAALDFKYMPHGRLTDPVGEVLAVDAIRFGSERGLKKLEADWKDSYVFLNNILERLKERRRRLEGFNPVGVFFKRMREEVQNVKRKAQN